LGGAGERSPGRRVEKEGEPRGKGRLANKNEKREKKRITGDRMSPGSRRGSSSPKPQKENNN